jgi:LPXTG-motif cell wall-anchored protein
LGRFAEAEADAQSALKLNPNNEQAWKNLAWAQLKQGKYQDAFNSAMRAIALNPTDAEAYMIAAYAAERLKDHASMMKLLQAAAGLNPKFQGKLDAANAGGTIYDEDDESTLGGAIGSARGHGGAPWGLLAGILAALAAAGGLYFFLKRKKEASAVGADPKAALVSPNGRATAPSALGKYQLGVIIGRGGMGQVYMAMDTTLRREVAVKRMTKTLSELGAEARTLFVKEARTVAQLHHPAIVDIYDIVDSGDDVYLVFELVRGKTVQQLLAEHSKIPLKRCSEILKPVCEALEFAHNRSMVHRDLKPANIMVTDQGHIKLMDFGIARSLADAGARKTTVLAGSAAPSGLFDRTMHAIGTPAYMAPEAETGVICKEGDVYSLGVTLYEMLTGQIPFGSLATGMEKATGKFKLAGSYVPGLPPAVDVLISRALHPAPEQRLKTPAEFWAALEAAAR